MLKTYANVLPPSYFRKTNMTKEQLIADLQNASDIARNGANAPLLGGPIGLMWGILITLTLTIHWSIISGHFGWPESSLAILWIGFAILGATGSIILGRKIEQKAGANSVANRVESYVWIMFSAMMATLAFGVILNILLQKGTPKLFDFIVIIGFAGQGLAYGVVAKMTGLKWVHASAMASFISSAICFAALGTGHFYLLAAIATIVTIIAPSFHSMRKAP